MGRVLRGGGLLASSLVPAGSAPLQKACTTIQDAAPDARLVVLGYPRLFPRDPRRHCHHLGLEDQRWMNEKAAQLDAVIEKNVASVGARYVDTLEAFDGHELCSGGREYVNGLTRRAVAYSFHPSAPGQAQLAESAREAVFWP